MAKGYVITNWTEDQGLGVQLSYPEDLVVDLDDMMRIFYAHIRGAGEAGNVLVRLEKARSNVSSYVTGMESENQAAHQDRSNFRRRPCRFDRSRSGDPGRGDLSRGRGGAHPL